jgi:toxin ParE1/3/4
MLVDAVKRSSTEPEGPTTRARTELAPALRSLHLQHSRARGPQFKVKSPPHILYYHVITPDVVEIVRMLHEHMDIPRH